MVAAASFKDLVVSSSKLDNSSTYNSTSSLKISNTGTPILAPTATLILATSAMKPVREVTVDLPFEPVIPIIGALATLAKSSISPTTSTPALITLAISS